MAAVTCIVMYIQEKPIIGKENNRQNNLRSLVPENIEVFTRISKNNFNKIFQAQNIILKK